MSKRRRFIITSFLLTVGFSGVQLISDQQRFLYIGLLCVVTLALFFWSLREGLGRNMTLLALVLPVFFTMGVGLFWFLLPGNLITRLPILILYAVGLYALALTENIYTVSSIRTIALMRAARGVGFVLTLFTYFLLFDTILSAKMPIYFGILCSLGTAIPLFLQGFWSVNLEKRVNKNIVLITFISSLVVGEAAGILFFWPVSVSVGSLFLTGSSYLLLGLGQAKIEERLFQQTVREYLILGVAVFIGMFLATSWGK